VEETSNLFRLSTLTIISLISFGVILGAVFVGNKLSACQEELESESFCSVEQVEELHGFFTLWAQQQLRFDFLHSDVFIKIRGNEYVGFVHNVSDFPCDYSLISVDGIKQHEDRVEEIGGKRVNQEVNFYCTQEEITRIEHTWDLISMSSASEEIEEGDELIYKVEVVSLPDCEKNSYYQSKDECFCPEEAWTSSYSGNYGINVRTEWSCEWHKQKEPVVERPIEKCYNEEYLLKYNDNIFSSGFFDGYFLLGCDNWVFYLNEDCVLKTQCLSQCDKWVDEYFLEVPDFGNEECGDWKGTMHNYVGMKYNCWIPIKYCLRWSGD